MDPNGEWESTREDARQFFERLRGVYPELFAVAHAVTGNEGSAQNAVQRAVFSCWLENGRQGASLRLKGLARAATLKSALQEAKAQDEADWDCLADDPLLPFRGERTELRRAAALRYGCGLDLRTCARLTGIPQGVLRTAFIRMDKELTGAFGSEGAAVRRVRRALAQGDTACPDVARCFAKFEAEALETARPNRALAGILRAAAFAALCAAAVALFWFLTSLLGAPAGPA